MIEVTPMLEPNRMTSATPDRAYVYVIHEPLRRNLESGEWERMRDISAAREYGDLVYIFPAGRLSQEPDYLVRTAREKLREFRPQDYLLLSGDTAAIAVASVVAAQQLDEDADYLNVLVWDGRVKRYSKVTLRVWEPEDITSTND